MTKAKKRVIIYKKDKNMRDLLDKMKKLNENKNGKVITFDFDNTIVKSYEESNDGEETLYQYGGVNKQIIARIKNLNSLVQPFLLLPPEAKHLKYLKVLLR